MIYFNQQINYNHSAWEYCQKNFYFDLGIYREKKRLLISGCGGPNKTANVMAISL